MPNLFRDAAHGFRLLLKTPSLTALAVLALGLGVGVNASIFSLSNALLYRPLLVPDLDRLIVVHATRKGADSIERISLADVLEWRAATQTIDSVSAVARATMNLTGSGEPIALEAARVSPPFFQALGAQPELGRSFLPTEEEKGSDHVVVLAHSFWETRFGMTPDILRRTIKLDGEEYQIVGVMPKDVQYPAAVQLWLPAAFSIQEKGAHAAFPYTLVGRLKPGVTIEKARSEFQALALRSEQKYPDSHANRGARVALLRKMVNGPEVEPFMRMLNGAALFVLLIACADVAGLQYARLSGRTREIAIRSAIGAGRARLIGQFLTESLVLAALGAGIGVLCGYWGAYVLRSSLPAEVARYVPGWSRLGIDRFALVYALGLSVAAGIVSGVAPAWFGSRTNLVDTLKTGGRGTTGNRSRQRIRSVLVVSEMVLTAVLLIGAGLMVSGVRSLAEPGRDLHPESALTLRIDLPDSRYAKAGQRARMQEDLLSAFSSLPGVSSVAFGNRLPYAGSGPAAAFTIQEQPVPRPGTEPAAQMQVIGGAYFETLRIRPEQGRLFDRRDGAGAPKVAIISEHLARRYFAGLDPLGKHLLCGSGEPVTVVGVVADIRQDPWDHKIDPVIYRPFRQAPAASVHFLVRTSADPRTLIPAAREKVARIDPEQPVKDTMTYAKVIDDTMVGLRYVASMMAVFAIIGLLLSAAGVYGVMAYAVSERTHEIGLRMALGANRTDVVWAFGRWGLMLAGAGLGFGVPAALGFASLLEGLLFGVGAYDPASFLGGVLVLCSAVALACYVPLRRALAVDPIVTLRAE